jgi:hypothetical protein
MSEKALRAAVVKLAFDHPELRKDLLPLLNTEMSKQAATTVKFRTDSSMTVDPKNIVIDLDPSTTISPAVLTRLQRAILQRKLQIVMVDKRLQIQVMGVEDEASVPELV